MPEGICPLCLDVKEKKFHKSHYVPAALYPKRRKLQYATRISTGSVALANQLITKQRPESETDPAEQMKSYPSDSDICANLSTPF